MTTSRIPSCSVSFTTSNNHSVAAKISANCDPENHMTRGRIYKIVLKSQDDLSLGRMTTRLVDRKNEQGLIIERYVEITSLENFTLKTPSKIEKIEGVFIRSALLQSIVCGRKGNLLIAQTVVLNEATRKEFELDSSDASDSSIPLSNDIVKKNKKQLKDHELHLLEINLDGALESERIHELQLRAQLHNNKLEILQAQYSLLESEKEQILRYTTEVNTTKNQSVSEVGGILKTLLSKPRGRHVRFALEDGKETEKKESISFKNQLEIEKNLATFQLTPEERLRNSKRRSSIPAIPLSSQASTSSSEPPLSFDTISLQIEKCKKLIEAIRK